MRTQGQIGIQMDFAGFLIPILLTCTEYYV